MAWCTVQDVQSLTGKVVTDSQLDQAVGVIELSTGGRVLSLDATLLTSRNLDWLRRAVAYQAAWMADQPDMFSRMDVSTFSQDGTSATLKADALVLAPLARRCLKRLSWRGVRTIQPSVNRNFDRNAGRSSNAPDLPGYGQYGSAISSAYDDDLPYQPL